MKTRQKLLLGLAGLGFVLAAPTYAGPAGGHEGFALSVQLAARDNAEPRHEQRRDREFKSDERGKGNRNQQLRDNERNVPQEYGYGYERRQQPLPPREEGRHRH